MKIYQVILDFKYDEGQVLAKEAELYGFDRYDIEMGNFIDNWNPDIYFKYDPSDGNEPPDYLGNVLGWFIISTKTKQIFESIHVQGVQYFPVRIINKETTENLEGYYVVNITILIEALDFDNSTYSYFDVEENEKILNVVKYALIGEKVKDVDMFRVKESPFSIFVSEIVRDSIIANRLSGFDFLKVKVS